MPDRTEALVLAMSADIKRMERALNQARGLTNRQLGQIESRFDRMNAHVRRTGDQMASDLRRAIAAVGVGIAIREVVQYGDAWTAARNKLLAVGVANQQVAPTMDRLVGLAKETRSEFEATVTLYARLTQATEQLGFSEAERLKITENTLKAIAAGGASAGEQAATITQLSQAIASVLGGDELRSIRENAPVVFKAIAKEAGVTTGELKALGAEGKLTGELVARALLNADEAAAAFAKTTKTVEQSITNLRTEFTRYIGTSETAQNATRALAGFIDLVAENLDALADAAIVAASILGGALAVGAIARLGAALVTMVNAARGAATAMKALQIAMTFFTGPVGAIILAIGAGLGVLAVNALRASNGLSAAEDALVKLGQANAAIQADTDKLAEANRRLETAIASQGPAAVLAARLEVESIQKRIAANQKLADAYKVLAENEIRAAQNDPERNRLRLAIATQGQRAFPGVSLGGVDFPELRRAIQSTPAGQLSDSQQAVAELLRQLDVFEARVALARDQLEQLRNIDSIAVDGTGPGGVGAGDGKSKLNQFRTDLEKLNDALSEIRDSGEGANIKSRAAVQALLDYARAVQDIAAVEAQIGSVEDLLAEGDWGLLHMELRKLAEEMDDVWASLHSTFGLGDVTADDLAPTVEFEDAELELRNATRQAVREGLREGIRTDDWGQALRNTVADAMIAAFDKSIDHLADLLYDILFSSGKSGGGLAGLISAGVGAITGGFGGGSAISTAAVNGAGAGLSGAGASINAPLIIQGSIDAVTWPRVQQAFAEHSRQIAARIPGAVNATIIDNRAHKRRI